MARNLTLVNYNSSSSSSSSSSDDDEVENISPQKPKRARIDNNWTLIQTFDSFVEADNFVKKNWAKEWTKNYSIGKVNVYYCRDGGQKCPSKVKILSHSSKLVSDIFSNDIEHHHSDSSRLGRDVKEKILEIWNNGVKKPNLLLKSLEKNQIFIEKAKLLSFLAYHKNKIAPRSISLGEMENWCKSKEEIPEEMDQPYVVNHSITENSFHIFISTKRLLNLAQLSRHIHADTTYKLNYEGYPVFLIGTTDRAKHFHPYGIGICSSENSADFEAIFQSMKIGFENLNHFELEMDILISDAAGAIRNGFKKVFNRDNRKMCWAHVSIAYDNKLKSLDDKTRSGIKNDIKILQTSTSSEIFNSAKILWKNKWENEAPEFVKYFNTYWIESNYEWFAGYLPGYPSTNNALESVNRTLKDEYTLRERLPIGQYLTCAEETLRSMSFERNPENLNAKLFNTEVNIDLELETKSYQWTKSNPKPQIFKEIVNGQEFFFIKASKSTTDMTTLSIKKYTGKNKANKWTTFEDFAKMELSIWFVTLDRNSWKNSSCTCPNYFKNYICKHIVGISYQEGLCRISLQAKNIMVGQKRKPGRPKAAKKALIIQ